MTSKKRRRDKASSRVQAEFTSDGYDPVESLRRDGSGRYGSIMCSTPHQRIAAFGRAIEDLASRARSDGTGAAYPAAGEAAELSAGQAAEPAARQTAELGAGEGAELGARQAAELAARAAAEPGDGRAASVVTPGGFGSAAPGDVLNRLAELWAELATLDPEVARRLPTYEA